MKSYKDIKICCYAISAGEPENFIDRWLESMNGADYICVLITKEGDPNWDYFNKKKKDYPQLILKQKTIKPWRFDVARNESMKLIPEDSDVLICTDIDEVLIPDFWDDLRKVVFEHPNFNRIYYRYAWSHDNNGEPKWVFWYDKICQPKGWKWYYPVHETLKCDKEKYNYQGEYYLNKNKIYLHHFPDSSKSRSSYLKLLEQRAQEYPEDLYGIFYLAREYSFIKDWQNALYAAYKLYISIIQKPILDDMKMLPSVLCMLGDFSNYLGLKDDAEFYFRKAIKVEPGYRDGYIKLAQLLAYQPRPQEVYKILEDASKKSKYQEDWRLTTYYWRDWKINQIIADAKCWEKKYKEAYNIIQEALKDSKTSDDIIDAKKENLYNDLNFIKNKLKT